MKEHIQAAMVNELCNVARRYHDYGCLRELLRNVVEKGLKADADWNKDKIEKMAKECWDKAK